MKAPARSGNTYDMLRFELWAIECLVVLFFHMYSTFVPGTLGEGRTEVVASIGGMYHKFTPAVLVPDMK